MDGSTADDEDCAFIIESKSLFQELQVNVGAVDEAAKESTNQILLLYPSSSSLFLLLFIVVDASSKLLLLLFSALAVPFL
jgi:hypothetical protein